MSPRKAAVLRDGGDLTLRDHLIATAERMIAARGTAGLTVRAIASEAGVASGVLYNHFADKEELLATALRAHVQAVERMLGALPEPGAATVAANLRAHVAFGLDLHRRIMPAFTGLLGRPEVLARFAADSLPGEEWRDRLVAYLEAERDLGRLAPTARPASAAAMIVGVCHEAVLSALLHRADAPGEPPPPGPADIDDLIATILHGIAP